jgi:hypothetical protein
VDSPAGRLVVALRLAYLMLARVRSLLALIARSDTTKNLEILVLRHEPVPRRGAGPEVPLAMPSGTQRRTALMEDQRLCRRAACPSRLEA